MTIRADRSQFPGAPVAAVADRGVCGDRLCAETGDHTETAVNDRGYSVCSDRACARKGDRTETAVGDRGYGTAPARTLAPVKICALVGLALAFAACEPAFADPAPSTVSDYYATMLASAARLDAQVSDRQQRGDMAAAQRVALAAAMVRRSAEEFRGAEQASMQDPVAQLPAPIPERADAALDRAKQAELAAADHAGFLDEAHMSFNALIAALPLHPPHPIVYGLLSSDLADPAAPLRSDIVIFGFRLVDPIDGTPPTVLYGKTALPAASVVVKDDEIDIALPDAVKDAVHFEPPACLSRPAFGLRVAAAWAERRGLWPIRWNSQMQTNADVYALPTPVVYTATILSSFEAKTTKSSLPTFAERSSLAIAKCEQAKSVDVKFRLPDGAEDAVCSAAWVDTTGAAKVSSHCAIEDGAAHAVGSISGGAKVCSPDKLCSCATPAQGWMELHGTYRIEETGVEIQTVGAASPLSFPAGGAAQGRLAADEAAKLRHVALTIARRGCPTPVDTIDLSIGDDPQGEASGVSGAGAFRAFIKSGDLRVGSAQAFAPDARNAP